MSNLVVVARMVLLIPVVLSGLVYAQNYPTKPIRIIAATAGGGTDIVARIIAQGITGPLGQPIVVDNRLPSLIGEAVAAAPPDGYTLLVHGAILWITPLLQKTPYDPVKDFAPITTVVTQPYVIVAHPSLPVNSVKDLINLAKARPGALNYSSGPVGSPAFIAGELFKSTARANIVGIQYKSGDAAVTGLITGDVQVGFLIVAQVIPQIKAGRLKALAVSSAEPTQLLPGLPTVAASGLPGYTIADTIAAYAPAKTPAAIVTRLNQEMVRVLTQPGMKEKFLGLGFDVAASSPEESAATMKAYMASVANVIKDAGIKPE